MNHPYTEELLDLARHPRNKKKLSTPDITYHDSNPTCGDEITIYARTNNGKIKESSYEGKGCLISQAAAELLTENIRGKTLNEASRITPEEITTLLGTPHLGPVRIKCAMLAAAALKKGIQQHTAKEEAL